MRAANSVNLHGVGHFTSIGTRFKNRIFPLKRRPLGRSPTGSEP
jgi:hypothetical protein